MNQLNVFFEKKKVGTLYRDEELVYSFTYAEGWLDDKEAFPLSLAMPLSRTKFGNKITLSFFENLLPEGEARDSLEKAHDLKGSFELLENFGSDCAGAIIISPSEQSPFKPDNKLVRIEMDEIFQAIEEKRSVAEVLVKQDPGYLSIAGAQDKFVAIYEQGDF